MQHRRQIFGQPQHTAPLFQALVLIPVEIIDQRILFPSPAGPGVFACSMAASERASTASLVANSASSRLAPLSSLSPSPPSTASTFSSRPVSLVMFSPSCAVADDACPRKLTRPPADCAQKGGWAAKRWWAFRTSRAMVSSWVGVRLYEPASSKTRPSRWTSSPSIHNEAQASAKCVRWRKPWPTGERRGARRAQPIWLDSLL